LLDWKETYRFKIPATRECPDIFQLKDEASDEIKWVFIEANGKYLVGDFVDGKFIFETKTENFFVKQGNYFAYAGQTFCNSPDNSIYYIAWQRDFCESNKFSQSMTFPVELKLFNNKLLTLPVKSLKNLRKQRWTFNNIKDIPYIPVKSNLWELEIESNPDIAVSLSIDGVEFEFDPVNKKMLAGATTINYPDNESIFRGSIYFDHNSIEIFDYKGRFWASKAVTRRYNKTFSKIWPHVPGGIISKLTVHELASIWN
jgi:levanase/fructan beta-fructosidase